MNPSAGAGSRGLPQMPQFFLYLREKNREREHAQCCACACVRRADVFPKLVRQVRHPVLARVLAEAVAEALLRRSVDVRQRMRFSQSLLQLSPPRRFRLFLPRVSTKKGEGANLATAGQANLVLTAIGSHPNKDLCDDGN